MKLALVSAAALAVAMFAAQAAQAQESIVEAASAFGVRPSVIDIGISPSGNKLYYLAPGANSEEIIYVVDLAGGGAPVPITRYSQTDSEITGCDWATEERLVCTVYVVGETDSKTLISFTRTFSIADDGSGYQQMTAPQGTSRMLGFNYHGGTVVALDVPGEDNKILLTRDWVEESNTGSRVADDSEGLGVELVDVVTGRRSKAENPDETALSYIADETGEVRLKIVGTGAAAGSGGGYQRVFYYRPLGSRTWQELTRSDRFAGQYSGFEPYAVDSQKNIAYGFRVNEGYEAVYAIALDGSGEMELVHSQPGADVSSLMRVGRQRRVVGVRYATDRNFVRYFDPEYDKLASDLSRALPGTPGIGIVDASADESKLLIIASSDVDPGTAYLFDRRTNQLSELLPMRSALEGRSMAQMRSITYPAADGTQIPAYLTLPAGSDGTNLPAVVMPHGGPSARDTWGFDWLVQFFAARGYAVIQPNYRSSAGMGIAWLGRNGFQDWQRAVGDVNDAGRWLVSEGIADPAKLAGVGWSYGGYAVLQSQVVDPGLFKAVVAIAPVTELNELVEGRRNYSNFQAWDEFMGRGPHRQEGSPARFAESFSAPVMLVHGTHDLNTWVAQSRLMEDRLKKAGKTVEYVEYDSRDHYIDDSWARANMLVKIDGFLDEHLPD